MSAASTLNRAQFVPASLKRSGFVCLQMGTTGLPAVDNDADFAAYQLSQLLGILAIRAEEVSKAAQGPAALGLSYGTAPPTPADVPWLRFASKRKPVLAWMTAAYYVILNGWRAVTSWAEGIKKLIGGTNRTKLSNCNLDNVIECTFYYYKCEGLPDL